MPMLGDEFVSDIMVRARYVFDEMMRWSI